MNKFPALIIIIVTVSGQKYLDSSTVDAFSVTRYVVERQTFYHFSSLFLLFPLKSLTLPFLYDDEDKVELRWNSFEKIVCAFHLSLLLHPQSLKLENIVKCVELKLMNFSTFSSPFPPNKCVILTFFQTFLSFFINFTFLRHWQKAKGSSINKNNKDKDEQE